MAMSDDASRLIDQLFERVKEAEKQTGERDSHAESQINKRLVEQPSAPYYMAQTIIMQEAALKRLNARVEQLERKLTEKPSSGGFLSGLFGGDSSQGTQSRNAQNKAQAGWGDGRAQYKRQGASQQQASGPRAANQTQPNQNYGTGGNRSFLGGALQTAAGVAGGVVVGSMLMNMFGHHTPTEMVDVIQEEPTGQDFSSDNMGDSGAGADDFASNGFDTSGADQGGFGQAGFDQNNGFDQSNFEQSNFEQSNFDQGGFADTGSDSGGFGQGGFDDFGGGFDDFGDDFDI